MRQKLHWYTYITDSVFYLAVLSHAASLKSELLTRTNSLNPEPEAMIIANIKAQFGGGGGRSACILYP
jgi:hypothetical protein